MMVRLIIAGIFGYLLGSVNFSIIIGRIINRIDVRLHGSGNAGTTNTLRVLGPKTAALVLIGDVLKGYVACLFGAFIMKNGGFDGNLIYLGVFFAGALSVLGHNFPVFHKFQGGKGVATTAGVILYANWIILVMLVIIFALITILTKYVSLGSITVAILYTVFSILFRDNIYLIFMAIASTVIIVLRHHKNIERLIKGEENKIGSKKKV